MAEAPSNAELDLHAMSRDGKNATYRVIPTAEGEGNRVEQILGEPVAAKDETAGTPAAKAPAKSATKSKSSK